MDVIVPARRFETALSRAGGATGESVAMENEDVAPLTPLATGVTLNVYVVPDCRPVSWYVVPDMVALPVVGRRPTVGDG